MFPASDIDTFLLILDFLIPIVGPGLAGFLTQLQGLVQTFAMVG